MCSVGVKIEGENKRLTYFKAQLNDPIDRFA